MPDIFTCIIIDDEVDAIELLAHRLGHLFKNISIIGKYTTWEDGLQGLRENRSDLLFLDISMPGKNGIALLKLVPNLQCEIIFVTAHDDYALDAFTFSATGYILKPIDDEELSAAIVKALERATNRRNARQVTPISVNEKIGIPNNHGIDYINVHDIMYMESLNKCTKIVTAKGEYISSTNIGKFQSITSGHPFFQVHRSYIINLNCIARYESSLVVIMTDKKEIPVSRNVKNDFLKLFNDNF